MRFKTLVLNPLTAVLTALIVVSLPVSQVQISANAPQEVVDSYKLDAINDYISERDIIVQTQVSRSKVRADISQRVITTGVRYLGTRYCHGGTTPRCFDCSGFTQFIYKQRGIDIPRIAQDQYRKAKKIKRSNAIKGDLVFFMHGGHVYHVGIYMGNNRVLHSPKPGRKVRVEYIWTKHVKFGRI